MCRAAVASAPKSRAANAAQTAESIPPLSATTTSARLFRIPRNLHALQRRLPDELMDLKSQPRSQPVRQHPLGKLLRINQAVRRIANTCCILAKRGRENHRSDSRAELMLSDKFPREFVIAPAGNHKFHLVVGYECAQILYAESVTLAGVGTLHIHDFHYLRRHAFQRPLTARLQQNGVACNQQPVHQRNRLALLQHRLASGDLDQAAIGRETMHLVLDFLERHAVAALEGVLAVAPGTAQVASRQPHKNARQARVGGLSLQRLVNLYDLHGRRYSL